MVIGQHLLNSMKRNIKDKMWTISDKKLFTTDRKTNGRADRFIKDCVEVSMVMRS